MQLKSKVQSEPRNVDENLKTSFFDEENDDDIIMMKLQPKNKPLLPLQTTIVLSEGLQHAAICLIFLNLPDRKLHTK